jgi:hypothetical protein
MSTSKNNTEKLYDVIKRPLITEKSMTGVALVQFTPIIDLEWITTPIPPYPKVDPLPIFAWYGILLL